MKISRVVRCPEFLLLTYMSRSYRFDRKDENQPIIGQESLSMDRPTLANHLMTGG